MRSSSFLDRALTVLFLAAATAIVLRTLDWVHVTPNPGKTLPLPKESVPIGAAVKGSHSAQAVMIEFSDFECPFCGQFERNTLPELQRRYIDTGRVLLVFRNFPLPSHPFAKTAAIAAECAGRQGKFWEMHDLLFADQAHLRREDVVAKADRLTLQRAAFAACLADDGHDQVSSDLALGKSAYITSTPAFMFGRRESDGRVKVTRALVGNLPINEFEAALESVVGDK